MLNPKVSRGLMAALLCCTGTAVTALAQPANNACGANTASFTIPGGGGIVSQTTTDTTGWTRDTTGVCTGSTGADVYWYFTPNAAGPWQIDTCTNPSFDSVLSIHNNVCPVGTGNYANGLAGTVACGDDNCGSSSRITVTLTAGNTYIIRVGRFSGTAAAAYTLTVANVGAPGACCTAGVCTITNGAASCTAPGTFQGAGSTCSPNPCPQPPANDLCANATVFSGTGFTVTGNNNQATNDGWANITGGTFGCAPGNTLTTPASRADLWYQFTPSVTNNYNLAMCSSTPSWDSVLSVHTACPGAGVSNTLACNDDGTCATGVGLSAITGLNLTSGVPVWIRVARFGATGTQNDNFTLTVTSDPLGACCSTAGVCSLLTSAACTSSGGTYAGDGTTCATTVCTGACCNVTTGACTATGPAACVSPDVFQGVSTVCSPNPCPQPPPPANDECSGALVATLGTTSGTNAQATTDSSASCQSSSNKDVWYTFTATTAGSYQFDTEGSVQTDTVLSLLDGCGGTELACDDDGGTGLLSSLVFSMTANQTVTIRLASFGTTPAGGVFNLNIASVVAGACCNDTTGVCTTVVGGICPTGATYQGDNTTCAPSPCPPSGSCCNIATGACSLTVESLCGVGSTWTLGGICTPNPCPQPPPPANDECTSAVVLTVGNPSNGTITNSTGTDISTCSGSSIDVWFSITPAAGFYTVTSTPSSASDDATALAVYTSCPPAADSDIACSAQPGLGATNTVLFNADGTTTYYIRAAGFAGDIGAFSIQVNSTIAGACCAASGACTITSSTGCTAGVFQGDNTTCTPNNCPQPQPPTNDTCATAIVVNGTASGNITTLVALNENDEPVGTCNSTAAVGLDNSIWFTFTPGSAGTLAGTIDMDYDGIAVLYSGGCGLANLTELACWDLEPMDLSTPDEGSSALTPGVTYFLAIGDWGSSDGGGPTSYTITVPAASTGRCCIGARCAIVAPAQCVASGTAQAVFTASATDCNASGVNTAPCCFADYNKAGGVTVQDIFDFLTDYFTGSVNANVGGDGTTLPTVQDIFDYLTAYFAGGC